MNDLKDHELRLRLVILGARLLGAKDLALPFELILSVPTKLCLGLVILSAVFWARRILRFLVRAILFWSTEKTKRYSLIRESVKSAVSRFCGFSHQTPA